MSRNFRRFWPIVLLLLFVGCAGVHKQAFNKDLNHDLKTIGVLEPAAKEEYFVVNNGHVGQGFGLAGALIAAADMQSKTNQFTELMKAREFKAPNEFLTLLQAELQDSGYAVKILNPKRENPVFLESYDSLDKDLDAYLDLSFGAGYQCASAAADYIPTVRAAARLVKKGTNEILYQDVISYGFEMRHAQAVSIPSDQKYFFQNFDAIKEKPDLAMEGMKTGLPLVAKRIAQDLAR